MKILMSKSVFLFVVFASFMLVQTLNSLNEKTLNHSANIGY